ncbi:MAG: ATP-binding domain-containing protein, partial [Bacteroidales bacterium]|nr:ATP-binding domain-containing protein [Bacteroidales bacterium]
IYQWRGARPDLFVQFAADKTIILDENYRSTPRILDIANCVIANNQNRIPKDLFTRKAEGRAVIHFHGKSEKEEMEWIVTQIKMILKNGAKPNEVAILYRSSHQSRALEQELLNAHLEYAIWGGTRFFERKEIKDALAYLHLVNNQDNDLAFERIINVPSRKLGRKFLDAVRALSEAKGISLYSALQIQGDAKAAGFIGLIEDAKQFARENRVSDLLNRILDRSGYKQMVREDQDEDRLENLDELLHSIRYYESIRTPEESTLADYLQDIALYTNEDHRKDTPTLKLMTIHQAKGLEFPYVFIIGLSEGIFPNMRTIREGKKDGEEEERRLMYVAITRAEQALFLTESEGFNISTKTNKYPSRFLAEIKRELVVTEGVISPELWKGTKNLSHVLDEDFEAERADYNDSPFQLGDTVTHPVFGEGKIVGANKDYTSFEVEFDNGTTRTLRAGFIKQADLPE